MPLYGQFAGSRPVCPGLGSNTATLEVLSIQDLRPLQGKNELRTSPFRNRRYTAVLQREFCCKLLRCGWGCGRGSPDLIRLAYFSSIRHPKSVLVLTGHDHRNGKQMKSRVPKFVSHGKEGLREKTPAPNAPFPIVAIGASAGGLEAYTEFFHALPADTGMAFVLVQHLDPSHHSMLPEILAKTTRMAVEEVKPRAKIRPNRVYVIPSGVFIALADSALMITPRSKGAAQHLAVNFFYALPCERAKERCQTRQTGFR
jgi:hypothetical protein